MGELRAIRGDRPVAEQEMDFARTNRVAGLPASLESNDQVANAVVNILQNNLPPDYYQQYVRRISAITGEQVATVAAKYIDPAHMVIVIVGDRTVIEPGLRAANVAPIVVVDESGKPAASQLSAISYQPLRRDAFHRVRSIPRVELIADS